MPPSQRVRNDRMTLLYSAPFEEGKICHYSAQFKKEYEQMNQDILVKMEILGEKNNTKSTQGELKAAARYLTRSLVTLKIIKNNGVRDSKYNPEDEVLWREDCVLKKLIGLATSSPDDSDKQEAMKLASEDIEQARVLRNEIRQRMGTKESNMGGARHALVNAIRNAWLICAGEHISYGRRTNIFNEHVGPLNEFIESVIKGRVNVNCDELHKQVLKMDKELHPELYRKDKVP